MTDTTALPTSTAKESYDFPSYLVAADMHNLAADKLTLGDYVKGGAGAAVGAAIGSLVPVPILGTIGGAAIGGLIGAATAVTDGKWAAASITSGAVSFYNTAIQVTNWFGANNKEAEVGKILQSYDSDLAKYYENNKVSSDLSGFFAGSLIPTVAALKIYNYSTAALNSTKMAKYGDSYAAVTGLLAPKQAKYLEAASKELTALNNPQIALNANYLKAVAVGAAEEAIQGAVATTAVIATMKASPVFNEMDAGDVAKNVLEGAIFGGVLGGAVRGAISYGSVKRSVVEIEKNLRPVTWREGLQERATDTDNLMMALLNKKHIEAEVPADALATSKRDATLRSIDNQITESTRALAKGDAELAEGFTNLVATLGNDTALAKLHGVTRVDRWIENTAAEASLDKALRDIEYLKSREATRIPKDPEKLAAYQEKLEEAKTAAKAAEETLLNTYATTLRLWGHDAGSEFAFGSEVIPSLMDTLKKGEQLKVTSKGVKAGSTEYNFTIGDEISLSTENLRTLQARQIWALENKINPDLVEKLVIHHTDLPMLKAAYEQMPSLPYVQVKMQDGSVMKMLSQEDILNQIGKTITTAVEEQYVLREFSVAKSSNRVLADAELAARLDVKPGFIDGTALNLEMPTLDLFALRAYSFEYTQQLRDAGKWTKPEVIPVWRTPQHMKITTDLSTAVGIDGFYAEGITLLKQKQQMYQTAVDNTIMGVFGQEVYNMLPEASTIYASAQTGMQGMVTQANAGLGTFGSMAQQIGKVTKQVRDKFKEQVSAALQATYTSFINDGELAATFSVIDSKIRGWGSKGYLVAEPVLNAAGRPTGEMSYFVRSSSDTIAPISLTKKEYDAFLPHVQQNAVTRGAKTRLQSVNGYDAKAVEYNEWYPVPVNSKDYPYFAFVIDPSVTATRRTSMIYAASEQELDSMIQKINASNLNFEVSPKNTQVQSKALTKAEVERFYKAKGEYDLDDAITDNYIDTALKRVGVSSNARPPTDPKLIADNLFDWHMRQQDQLVRYMVETKYSKEFAELHLLAEGVTDVATSKAGFLSNSKFADARVLNPYQKYIRTALDITDTASTPIWTAVNNYADKKFSELWSSVKEVMGSTSEAPLSLDRLNNIYQKAGFESPYRSLEEVIAANHTASRGSLNTFVTRANSILASLQLRLDFMNPVVNVISSTILTSPELKTLVKGIQQRSPELAGELAYIKLPGTKDSVLSPMKIQANGIKSFFDPKAREWAAANGFSSRYISEFAGIVDDLTLKGNETTSQLSKLIESSYQKAMKVADVGEKVTGNKLAEDFNRMSVALGVKSITDTAVEQGIITEKQALAYINTVVNRTQGAVLASQRPLLFQGPVGQALGLFQSYQFNLIQQLLRHVSNGQGKMAAMAMGLQSTIYGIHGLPGFDYVNAEMVGTAAGNTNNRDLYDATYGMARKDVADWIMYGAASNVLGLFHPDLKAALYTRGDINPRFATIIPTSIKDVPIVSAYGKMYSSFSESFKKIAAGGDVWSTFLQGIEHSGVNRPLIGLAQVLQAVGDPNKQSYVTSSKGNIVATNDLYSLANLVRLTGAKPFDQSIAQDAVFRIGVYEKADMKKLQLLGEAIKSTVIGGKEPSAEQFEEFLSSYVQQGGRQENFSKWVNQLYKSANTSQANLISQHLKSPFAQSMQQIMGGGELKDFNNAR